MKLLEYLLISDPASVPDLFPNFPEAVKLALSHLDTKKILAIYYNIHHEYAQIHRRDDRGHRIYPSVIFPYALFSPINLKTKNIIAVITDQNIRDIPIPAPCDYSPVRARGRKYTYVLMEF